MTDLLRIETNERVDLEDFDFLANTLGEAEAEKLANFNTSPTRQRMWILDGFAITNPSASQVCVTRGRAILARRDQGIVKYGSLVAGGDATKILDVSGYASATYGIYVRFDYVDSEFRSRVFWNPVGDGSEFAQTVATRRAANWSLTIEATNPGAEWLQIGTVVQSTMVIVDMRPFFFEGEVHNSYQSGWSTDGGGVAHDRSASRALYGANDLQMFTAAMRQCLKDIKGRGLREWYSRDIGGMNLGFDAAPVEDRLAVGDANFYLDKAGDPLINFDSGGDELYYSRANNAFGMKVGTTEFFTFGRDGAGTSPRLALDTGDYLEYNRASNYYGFSIATVEEARLNSYGLGITNGLNVGMALSSNPVDDTIQIGVADFNLKLGATDYFINLGTQASISSTRSVNALDITACSVLGIHADDTGVSIPVALNVGFNDDGIPGYLCIGDTQFALHLDTDPYVEFATGDMVWYDRSLNLLNFEIGSSNEMTMGAGGLRITNGLLIGAASGTPANATLEIAGVGFALNAIGGNPKITLPANSRDDKVWEQEHCEIFLMQGTKKYQFLMANI